MDEGTSKRDDWQSIGSASERVVALLAARLGGVVPAGKKGPAQHSGHRAGQVATAREEQGSGREGEHQNQSPDRLVGAPMLSK